MGVSEWVDLEWHEQIARRVEAGRVRPLRISDLIGAVVISALVLGLLRFAVGVLDRPQGPPILVWLEWVAFVGVLAGLGVALAVALGGWRPRSMPGAGAAPGRSPGRHWGRRWWWISWPSPS